MERPLVSIMMPAYNAGKYIGRAIESVLAQTYDNWELIIVDDGSTDNTYEVASRYKDPRIRIFRDYENTGPGPARNKAITYSRGEWLAYLDADDEWLPNRLDKLISALPDLNCERYFVTDVLTRCFDKDGELVRWKRDNLMKKIDSGTISIWTFEDYLSNGHPIIAPLFPHSVVSTKNIKFESLPFAEDLDFWINLFVNGLKLLIVPDSLYMYRLSPNSRTSNAALKDLCYVYDKWLNTGMLNEVQRDLIMRLEEKAKELAKYQPFANKLKERDIIGAISVALNNPSVLLTFVKGIPSMLSYRLSALRAGVRPR